MSDERPDGRREEREQVLTFVIVVGEKEKAELVKASGGFSDTVTFFGCFIYCKVERFVVLVLTTYETKTHPGVSNEKVFKENSSERRRRRGE
jgi:hypothetical protein